MSCVLDHKSKMFKLFVKGSAITNYFFPSARVEFVLVDETITEVRDYDGISVFNAQELDSPLTETQVVLFRNMKKTFEEALK